MNINALDLEKIVAENGDKIDRVRQAIVNFSHTIHAKVLDERVVLGDLYSRFQKMHSSLIVIPYGLAIGRELPVSIKRLNYCLLYGRIREIST